MSNETILVVDDNDHIVNFLTNDLLPSLGYRARSAYDGKTALSILRTGRPDLILLDLELPDMNGLDILRQMERENLKVASILITAHGSEQVAVDAFRLGVYDYLTKPVDIDRLNSAISRALIETRLRQETRRLTELLRSQVSWLTILSRIGKSVTSTLELEEVLTRIVEAGVHLTHAEEGFLALLEESSGQLYLSAVKNLNTTRHLHLPVKDSLLGQVVQTQRPVRISNIGQANKIKVSTGLLVQSLLHVPILSKGKLAGVLSVDNQNISRPFSEGDEALLTSLADYAAVAIENANLYQQAQQEIQERKRIEAALRQSEERYALAIQGANDGLWDWDLKTNCIYFSARWKAMLGYTDKELGNSPNEWFDRIHAEDIDRLRLALSAHLKKNSSQFETEYRIQHKDGGYRWVLSRGIAVWGEDGLPYRMAGSMGDITDRKRAEQRLFHDAFYDRLTGLANRSLFIDRLHHTIDLCKRRPDYQFAVLFLDLDRFKDVNDSLGHIAGDHLLQVIARLLLSGVRATDTVARLGGDEFVILLVDITEVSGATRVAEWIIQQLAIPIQINNQDVYISTSIGIVLSHSDYQRSEDILRDADIAMYVAKAHGKARYEIFTPAMRENVIIRLGLETDLRQAIEGKQLCLDYQPIVSLKDGTLVGFEALVRWIHPQRGVLQPGSFIPMAEETGLILAIDDWVLREACRQIQEWERQIPGLPIFTMNVNISSKHLSDADLAGQVEAILRDTGVAGERLKIEITESAVFEKSPVADQTLARLQALGIQVYIDDFGTGYSSLGYLHQFPVRALKIDRSFVKRMDAAQGGSPEIVQTVIALAHDLGIQAVAEGVETETQLQQLLDMGCEYGQGYLVSRPMDHQTAFSTLADIAQGKKPFHPWNRS